MRIVHSAILPLSVTVLATLLGGCFSGSDTEIGPTNTSSGNGVPATTPPVLGFKALFQPLQGILPYPNDLYFSGTTDGTLNLPANATQPNTPALNALDGFSTTAYIAARFNGAVDPTTLTAATVHVVRLVVDNATKAPLIPPAAGGALPSPLTFGTDFTVSVSQGSDDANSTVLIRPTRPLEPSTGATNIAYLVLMTDGIKNASGAAAVADNDYATVRNQALAEIGAGASTPSCSPIANSTLRAICQLTFGHLRVGAAVGVTPANVVVSFAFSTQATRDSLAVVAQTIAASAAPAITAVALPRPGGGVLNTNNVISSLFGHADIYAGTVRIPYYLSVKNAACDAAATLSTCAPIRSSWTAAGAPAGGLDPASRNLTRFNPVPAKTADLDIPLLVTVPNAASVAGAIPPVSGWPVAIFQHGLTRNRTDVLAIADAFADAGFVVVSIDLPLHGITPTNTALAPFRQATRERTFDLDVSNNATLAPGPDGTVDGSGQNFVNLVSLLTTRDNLRQSSVDLLALTRALSALDLNGDTTPDIDTGRIHFVGHSLGSIVGTAFASLSTATRTASLLMTGGGTAQTIVDSPAFGPAVIANLQSQGLLQNTTLYNQFLRDAQTVIDAGDPINYFASLLAAKPVHVTQIVGGGVAGWPSDQVVPNSATQRMIAAGGSTIRRVNTGTNAVTAGNGAYINFLYGHHGSIIDPSCSGIPSAVADAGRCLATTVEMQRETVLFAAGYNAGANASAVIVTDTSVVQQ